MLLNCILSFQNYRFPKVWSEAMTGQHNLLVTALVCVGVVCLLPRPVTSHGRLWDPPARNTMWRQGFNTPADYDDHSVNCGGFGVNVTCYLSLDIAGSCTRSLRHHWRHRNQHPSSLSVAVASCESANVSPVHYLMLSSHRFFCLPRLRPPSTLPCKNVFAKAKLRVTCLYHFIVLTMVRVLVRADWCCDLSSHFFIGDV